MLLRLRHVQRTTRHAVPPLRAPRLTRAFASAAPEASDEASSSKEVTSSVSLTGAAAGAGTMPTTDTGTDTNTATSTHGRRRGARRMGTARSTRRTSSSHVVNHRALAVLDASVQRQLSCGSAKDVLSSTPLPPPPTRENAIDGRTAIPQHLLPDPSILDETLLVAQGLLHHPATRRTRLLALTADHPGANTYLEHVARTVAENMRAGFVVVELEQLVVAAHAVAHGERRLAARVGSVDDGGARKDFLRRGNDRRHASRGRYARRSGRSERSAAAATDNDDTEDEEDALELRLGNMTKFLDGVAGAFKVGKNGVISSVIKLEPMGRDRGGTSRNYGGKVDADDDDDENDNGVDEDDVESVLFQDASAPPQGTSSSSLLAPSPSALRKVFQRIFASVRQYHTGDGPCVVFVKDLGMLHQGMAVYEALLDSRMLERDDQVLVMTAETPFLRQAVAASNAGNGTAPKGNGGAPTETGNPATTFTPHTLWPRHIRSSRHDLLASITIPPPTTTTSQKVEWRTLMDHGRRHRTHAHNMLVLMERARERRIAVSAKALREVEGLGEVYLTGGNAQRVLLMARGHGYGRHAKTATGGPMQQHHSSVDTASLRRALAVFTNRRQQTVPRSSGGGATAGNPSYTESAIERVLDAANLKRGDLNNYEKKLLSNVMSADSIAVRFRNIACLRKTKETLQSLIALPLLRPSFFQHGVLSDTVSGVLMFGPPGTGKTMMAKAIAAECGSNFLNITPSVIYDMYVGEGEKNAKAVFTLARKLSPAVIFIDEIDSLFDSRDAQRSPTKREVINEFMAEWDGIASQNNGVIVVGATNRPFDLDDAILRRLPRRILIDLPTEEERASILKTLLKQERLDVDVSVEELAKQTALYSGSDLKNVCVSAAMQAVYDQLRAENNGGDLLDEDGKLRVRAQPSLTNSLPGSMPPESMRTLRRAHFEKAIKEVSSSANEQQESLERLRKWNRTFGDDNAGRRAARQKFGF